MCRKNETKYVQPKLIEPDRVVFAKVKGSSGKLRTYGLTYSFD